MNPPNTPHGRAHSGARLFRPVQRPRRFLAVIATVLFLAAAAQVDAQSGNGAIEGRVKNAVTGEYLNNARVTIKGTSRQVFTDASGAFRLNEVSPGVVTLHVFFTGLDLQEVTVNVPAGQTAMRDLEMTSRARYGAETVKLDTFVVQSTKETNASAIAVNEQRFSANIKSVVSTDEFGTIPDANPGEFMKWLPGVAVEYFANNIVGVSVRGLGSVNTEVSFDGMPIANMNSEAVNRAFDMKGGSSADIARVEIRRIPLPEDSANSVGGSINLVRRSAFEYSKRQISYLALLTSDGEELSFSKRDGPKDRKMDRWRPNWEVKWTEPINKNLGFAVTIGQNDSIAMTHFGVPGYGFGSAAQATAAEAAIAANQPLTTVSIYNPANTNHLVHDAPIKQSRDYAGARVDWRPAPGLTVGYSISGAAFRNQTADDVRYRWNTAATGAGDPRFVNESTLLGRVGGGAIHHDSPLWRDIYNPTLSNFGEAVWKKDLWTVSGKAVYSVSRHKYYDTEHGAFGSLSGNGFPHTGTGAGTANPIPLTVNFRDQTYFGPRTIEAFTTANGQASTNLADYTVPVDWGSASVARIGGARARPGASKEIVTSAKFFAKRDFAIENPFSIQAGFDYSERYRTRRYDYQAYRFVGRDGIPNSPDDAASQIVADFLPPHRDTLSDSPPMERLSLTKLYSLFQQNPTWFQLDENQSYRSTATSNAAYNLKEETVAPYLQGDWRTLRNRLRLTGGVRYEKVEADARGLLRDGSAAFQKYSDGSVRRANDVVGANGLPTTRAGAPVRLANVAAGSLEEALLTLKPKGATGEGGNDNYFPSLHATYDLTENLQLQTGYAKTQARNRFDRSVVPDNEIIDAVQSSGAIGRINMRNPELRPWIGHNYEARISYYNQSGGFIALGAYRKNIHDYQVSLITDPLTAGQLAEFGFGPELAGYEINTFFNSGPARITGAELELRQSLDRFVPAWARGFLLRGNMSYTNLKGRPAGGDFDNLNDRRDTVSLAFARRKLKANVGYIMNGLIQVQPETAAGRAGIRVWVPQHIVDFNVEYAITRWAKLFVSGKNVGNEIRRRERQFAETPTWANLHQSTNLGSSYTIGISGQF